MHATQTVPCQLEHINLTVSNAHHSAQLLCRIFDWEIRWQGQGISGGTSIHVGSQQSYLALYTPQSPPGAAQPRYARTGSLNHVAVVVDDLSAIESRVRDAGLTPFNHGDYEPGRRFYFLDTDGTEFEVVSYKS